MAHARKFKVENREARQSRRVKSPVSLVKHGQAYDAEAPAVHKMLSDLENAIQARDLAAHADDRIPVGYTIIGATAFSLLCWFGLLTLIHAIH